MVARCHKAESHRSDPVRALDVTAVLLVGALGSLLHSSEVNDAKSKGEPMMAKTFN